MRTKKRPAAATAEALEKKVSQHLDSAIRPEIQVLRARGSAHSQSLPPNMRERFAQAAREYRGEPPLAKPDAGLLRAMFLDAIGPVPGDALAAFVACDLGDDVEARERMEIVVDCVKRAARLFNALRRAESEAS